MTIWPQRTAAVTAPIMTKHGLVCWENGTVQTSALLCTSWTPRSHAERLVSMQALTGNNNDVVSLFLCLHVLCQQTPHLPAAVPTVREQWQSCSRPLALKYRWPSVFGLHSRNSHSLQCQEFKDEELVITYWFISSLGGVFRANRQKRLFPGDLEFRTDSFVVCFVLSHNDIHQQTAKRIGGFLLETTAMISSTISHCRRLNPFVVEWQNTSAMRLCGFVGALEIWRHRSALFGARGLDGLWVDGGAVPVDASEAEQGAAAWPQDQSAVLVGSLTVLIPLLQAAALFVFLSLYT